MGQISELSVRECLSLMHTRSVGRIALDTEVGIRIVPVNYVLGRDHVVFRMVPYGIVAKVAHGAQVAFEIDYLDDQHHTGWSVLAVGTCRRVEDSEELRKVKGREGPQPWAEGMRDLYFRIDWDELTGYRVGGVVRSSLLPESRAAATQEERDARGSFAVRPGPRHAAG